MVQIYILAVLTAPVFALFGDPIGHEFAEPRPTDQRTACPFLNTLANHGYVNRTGIAVSNVELRNNFEKIFNVDPAITDTLFAAALPGSSSTIQNTINYVDVNRHDLIEHDGSLSRDDAAVSNNFEFNATVWGEVTMFFTTPLISIEQMATARVGRINRQRAANPTFQFDKTDQLASLGATSLLMMAFSNGSTNGGASREQMDTFVRQERLPFDLGFTVPATRITAAGAQLVGAKLTNATGAGAGKGTPGAGTGYTVPAAGSSSTRTTVGMAGFGLALACITWNIL